MRRVFHVDNPQTFDQLKLAIHEKLNNSRLPGEARLAWKAQTDILEDALSIRTFISALDKHYYYSSARDNCVLTEEYGSLTVGEYYAKEEDIAYSGQYYIPTIIDDVKECKRDIKSLLEFALKKLEAADHANRRIYSTTDEEEIRRNKITSDWERAIQDEKGAIQNEKRAIQAVFAATKENIRKIGLSDPEKAVEIRQEILSILEKYACSRISNSNENSVALKEVSFFHNKDATAKKVTLLLELTTQIKSVGSASEMLEAINNAVTANNAAIKGKLFVSAGKLGDALEECSAVLRQYGVNTSSAKKEAAPLPPTPKNVPSQYGFGRK